MRLSLILLMLILLPVAAGVHAWLFLQNDLPALHDEAVRRLRAAGVRSPVVEIRFLDAVIRGEAEDPAAVQRAAAAIRTLGPLRLQPGAAQLQVTARIRGTLADDTLHITGWLPENTPPDTVRRLVAELRPDLKLDITALRTAPEVVWPEGFKPPLTAESPLLRSLVAKLHVPAEIRVTAEGDAILLSGLLPTTALKEEVVAALTEVAGTRVVDPSQLKASSHVLPAEFAKPAALAAFLRSFFEGPPPRSCLIDAEGIPHLKAPATRQQESEWLNLLRPLTGAAKVDAQLTLVPSALHAPGYQIQSQLPPQVLQSVQDALQQCRVTFDTGATRLSAEDQVELAALAPVLLSAGPALRLVIGAHPDPAGPAAVEKAVGRARAEAVLSFLVEQGVPSTDISAVVFDPVPADSAFAPPVPRWIEIRIK